MRVHKLQRSNAENHAQFSLKDCTACRRAGPAACHCELDAVPPATYTWPLEAAAAMTACNPLPVTNSYLQHDITTDINTSCALRQPVNTLVCKYSFRHRSVETQQGHHTMQVILHCTQNQDFYQCNDIAGACRRLGLCCARDKNTNTANSPIEICTN